MLMLNRLIHSGPPAMNLLTIILIGWLSVMKTNCDKLMTNSSGITPFINAGKSDYAIRFTNVKDGQVMTLDGDKPTPGLNITSTFWNNSESQKWLLIPRGDDYFILPKRQHKEWAKFLARTSQRDSLPSVTVVVGIDVTFGGITQQVLHGRSNQHWEFKDGKDGRVFISSPSRGKCITRKLPTTETQSLVQRATSKLKGVLSSKSQQTENNEAAELVVSDCDEKNMGQLWRLEPADTKK